MTKIAKLKQEMRDLAASMQKLNAEEKTEENEMDELGRKMAELLSE